MRGPSTRHTYCFITTPHTVCLCRKPAVTALCRPGAMRAGFAQFTAFAEDAEDNKIFQQTKLTMPVLAVGGEKSFGASQAVVMRNVASDVREAVVPGAGHWLMEESPTYTIRLIQDFLKGETSAARGA